MDWIFYSSLQLLTDSGERQSFAALWRLACTVTLVFGIQWNCYYLYKQLLLDYKVGVVTYADWSLSKRCDLL